MNKPVEIAFEEFHTGLVDLINTSGLPPFVIEQVLTNTLYEVKDLTRRNLEAARKSENLKEHDNE